ncbi:integrase [Salinibacter ruber]|jgi:integrase|uniref:tyrosine-type recombinase/integrase n=1 Tax=Salinibacter ruber TaxID=146919 RepID=UPI00161EFC61|nr:site-specific integrase [Salinibacter ruber]MBB4062295.1 integrase [Salinibacter ruber]MCS3936116.1 integrase [Salinibacter ruber]MCS4043397.1 integrase [Salinibacter ruber]
MSSLFKRASWTLQYSDDDRTPAKKQFSLGTSSKATAERLQAELDDLYLRGLFDPWTDDFRETLERYKRPSKPQEPISLASAKEQFVASRQGLSEATVSKYELVTRLFEKHVGMETRLLDVEPASVAQFLESRDLSLTSKHVYRRHLSVFFNWAIDQGWIEDNPADSVTLERKPDKQPKAFTKEEVDQLIEAAEGELATIILVASRTGLRLRKLTSLTWQNVDLEDEVISVRGSTKSGKERTVPLPERPAKALRELSGEEGAVFDMRGFEASQKFLEVRREVLPQKEDHSFHSLRHSYCTWLAEASVPIHVIKRLAGHQEVQTTMQYIHNLSGGHEHVDGAF